MSTSTEWTALRPSGTSPLPRGHHSAVSVGTRIIVYGGADLGRSPGALSDAAFLNLEGLGGWNEVVPSGSIPRGRCGHTAVVCGRQMMVFGGVDHPDPAHSGPLPRDSLLNDVNFLTTDKFVWSRPRVTGEPPAPRAGHSCVVVGMEALVFGGRTEAGPTNSLHSFHTVTRQWAEIKVQGGGAVPPPRYVHACCFAGKTMYVYGGVGADGSDLEDLWAYDVAAKSWKEIAPKAGGAWPGRCSWGVMCAMDSFKLMLAGRCPDTWVFDTMSSSWSRPTATAVPRIGASLCETGKKMYLIGGFPAGQGAQPITFPYALANSRVVSCVSSSARMSSASSVSSSPIVTSSPAPAHVPAPVPAPAPAPALPAPIPGHIAAVPSTAPTSAAVHGSASAFSAFGAKKFTPSVVPASATSPPPKQSPSFLRLTAVRQQQQPPTQLTAVVVSSPPVVAPLEPVVVAITPPPPPEPAPAPPPPAPTTPPPTVASAPASGIVPVASAVTVHPSTVPTPRAAALLTTATAALMADVDAKREELSKANSALARRDAELEATKKEAAGSAQQSAELRRKVASLEEAQAKQATRISELESAVKAKEADLARAKSEKSSEAGAARSECERWREEAAAEKKKREEAEQREVASASIAKAKDAENAQTSQRALAAEQELKTANAKLEKLFADLTQENSRLKAELTVNRAQSQGINERAESEIKERAQALDELARAKSEIEKLTESAHSKSASLDALQKELEREKHRADALEREKEAFAIESHKSSQDAKAQASQDKREAEERERNMELEQAELKRRVQELESSCKDKDGAVEAARMELAKFRASEAERQATESEERQSEFLKEKSELASKVAELEHAMQQRETQQTTAASAISAELEQVRKDAEAKDRQRATEMAGLAEKVAALEAALKDQEVNAENARMELSQWESKFADGSLVDRADFECQVKKEVESRIATLPPPQPSASGTATDGSVAVQAAVSPAIDELQKNLVALEEDRNQWRDLCEQIERLGTQSLSEHEQKLMEAQETINSLTAKLSDESSRKDQLERDLAVSEQKLTSLDSVLSKLTGIKR